jgi:AraC-like DNA-binding protein
VPGLSSPRNGCVEVWRPGNLAGLEFHRARDVTHFNPSEHIHAEYQLVLVQRGGRLFHHRGETIEAGPGQIVLVEPGEVHAGRCRDGIACCFRSMYLGPAHLDAALDALGMPHDRNPVFAPLIEAGDLADLLLDLDLSARGEAAPLEVQTRLALFCMRLVMRGATVGQRASRAVPLLPAVRRAREYLDVHYDEGVTLDDLAVAAGLSKYHLLRAFSAAFGLPPHAYQIQLRIMRAKELVMGGMPLKAVAAETGFADQSHLGRHFRRLTGLSPAAYRGAGPAASP